MFPTIHRECGMMPATALATEHSMKWLLATALACTTASAHGAGIDLQAACLDCHQPGQTRGDVPMIEGQHRDYLATQLGRFRELHRPGFPMSGLAAGIDAAAAEHLADALSQRQWRSASATLAPESVVRGRERVDMLECAACHGTSFLGSGDIPRLAGQQPGYLDRQLQSFGHGERHHPLTGIGTRMYALTDQETADIAAYLHALPMLQAQGSKERDGSED
jgi:cytochrome c553